MQALVQCISVSSFHRRDFISVAVHLQRLAIVECQLFWNCSVEKRFFPHTSNMASVTTLGTCHFPSCLDPDVRCSYRHWDSDKRCLCSFTIAPGRWWPLLCSLKLSTQALDVIVRDNPGVCNDHGAISRKSYWIKNSSSVLYRNL